MRNGDVLKDRYRLERRIGTGGMSEVWEAVDLTLHRTVAIKVLHPALAADPAFRERFIREARTLASLNAPGLIDLYDACEETAPDGTTLSYLVMELVDGQPLSQVLAQHGRLNASTTASILRQCATALQAAHGAGIVHRDIKPANILIGASGEVTVIDFGIARTHGHSALTSAGSVIGTVDYASPEQLRGDHLTPASDVYSLGIVGYECLAGRPPFYGESTPAIISAQLNQPPPPLPEDVPSALADIIAVMLSKDPAHRFASATELTQALDAPGEPRTTRTMSVGMATIPPPATALIDREESEPDEPQPDGSSVDQLLRRRTMTTVAVTLGVVVVIAAAAIFAFTLGQNSGNQAAQDDPTSASPTSPSPSPSPTGPDSPATSMLANAHSGQCVSITEWFLFTYTELVDCSTAARFEFIPSPSADDVFKIVWESSGDTCLNWTYGGAEVEPGTCDFNTAWKLNWIESTDEVDVWQIQSVSNGNYCLALGSDGPQGQECTEDANQQWHTEAARQATG
ncbi:serine/threonine protein kinase [Stackebrandtia endophytica]|uniref:non-specific serine/threonine protein kinase n=1 Tax=Stackebrandtia endophytica TaxID=1496996 RepID=A0A543B2J7_9ACTN|nr:serine/threonine-protein kinase [Stackebrandtia endophytica]TQL79059.1 serine/threonine protein kinase [Stackebrandtia endophytica]